MTVSWVVSGTGHGLALYDFHARMYDPATGRWLVPDPAEQFANPYLAMANNPVSYVDPDGEFAVVDSWLIGFVDGFFSSGSNRFENAWNEANHRAGNDAKIWGGLFASDPSKSFFGRVWEVTSRFTWQLPQTVGGFLTAHSYNTFGLQGGVEEVDYWGGATTVTTRNDGWGAVAQGSYIVGDSDLDANPHNPLFQHEYGHYLQSQSMGLAYYPRVGIPSIRSQGIHDFHPVEQDANRRAFLCFNENVEGFQDDTQLANNDPNNNRGWDFYRNPLNIDGSNTRGQYVDYQNAAQVATLYRIRVRARWYDYASWLYLPYGGPIWVGLINAGNYNR